MILDQISIHSFIQTNKLKTETGKILDFHTHRYLFDIYRDNSPFLCCIKAGQIGFSTMAIIKTMWLSRYQKIDIGYILPTVEMVQKFVGSKVNRMAQQNPIIASWFKDKDSVSQKQIGENYIFYLGAMTDRSAIMLTLDMLVADEYDKAPQEILEIYDSRLQHSKFGYKWIFSNPTIPDFGVSRFWEKSDKKCWHITHSCGKNYILDESCVNYKKEIYECPSCKEEITDEERRMGEWIATSSGKWSGYWIPLWLNPMITATTISEKKRNNTKEYFANFVAGTPYINSTNMLTQKVLENNLTPLLNEQRDRTILGMDTGHNIHYTMMNKGGIFYHGYCPSIAENPTPGYDPYNEIEKRLDEDDRLIVISDQGGDLIGIRKLQAKYPGRVYLCWFVKPTKTQTLIRFGEGDEQGKVLVDRNRVIQLVVDQFNDVRMPINGTVEDWQPFFEHAMNIYRVKEIEGQDENDPQYNWRWVWKRKGPDHWFLSLVYAVVGMDKFAEDLAVIVSKHSMTAGIKAGTDEHGGISGQRFIRGHNLDW